MIVMRDREGKNLLQNNDGLRVGADLTKQQKKRNNLSQLRDQGKHTYYAKGKLIVQESGPYPHYYNSSSTCGQPPIEHDLPCSNHVPHSHQSRRIASYAEAALLIETSTETDPDSMFPSHKSFVFPGSKVPDSIHGRLSGGVILLVRKEPSEYVERINIETDNFFALRLSHRLLGTSTDCLLVRTYLPPENSPYNEETDIYNGVSLLEDCLIELVRLCGHIPLIICGDLNS